MVTYVAVGWTIRSFYFNEIDRDLARAGPGGAPRDEPDPAGRLPDDDDLPTRRASRPSAPCSSRSRSAIVLALALPAEASRVAGRGGSLPRLRGRCPSFSSRPSTSSSAWSRSARSRSSGSSARSTSSWSCFRGFSSRPRSFPSRCGRSSSAPRFRTSTTRRRRSTSARLSGLEAARLLALQAGWTLVLLALGQWSWRRSRAADHDPGRMTRRPPASRAMRGSSACTSGSTRRPGWSTGSTSSRASSPRSSARRRRSGFC